MYLVYLNIADQNKCNCVKFARSLMPQLPFGLWTILDKRKIINSHLAKIGRVAIMNVGMPWGHVGVVVAKNGNLITIREANYKFCKITERTGTEAELKIIGYFKK
jgi:hypothetical protein